MTVFSTLNFPRNLNLPEIEAFKNFTRGPFWHGVKLAVPVGHLSHEYRILFIVPYWQNLVRALVWAA